MNHIQTNSTRFILHTVLLASLPFAWLVTGCGGGGQASTAPTTPGTPPAIVSQPQDASVPMGITAYFTVAASGTSLRYQWRRNNTPIPGATTQTLDLPTSSWEDSGAKYDVVVSNTWGTATSNAASLTVTARAPKQGDLRFQNVDSDATVNGHPNDGLSTVLSHQIQWDFSNTIGSPLQGGRGSCAPAPFPIAIACEWGFSVVSAPNNVLVPKVHYQVDYMEDFPGKLNTILASGGVMTSMDIEKGFNQAGYVWEEPTSKTDFTGSYNTVSTDNFATVAAQEGLASRVITAVAMDGNNIAYISYAWSGDTTTLYDVKTVLTGQSDAFAKAGELAGQGYIITAFVNNNDGKSAIVGTRVQGDTMPRPFSSDPAFRDFITPGYAVVGMIFNQDVSPFFFSMYER